jgi:hypothetical protein
MSYDAIDLKEIIKKLKQKKRTLEIEKIDLEKDLKLANEKAIENKRQYDSVSHVNQIRFAEVVNDKVLDTVKDKYYREMDLKLCLKILNEEIKLALPLLEASSLEAEEEYLKFDIRAKEAKKYQKNLPDYFLKSKDQNHPIPQVC